MTFLLAGYGESFCEVHEEAPFLKVVRVLQAMCYELLELTSRKCQARTICEPSHPDPRSPPSAPPPHPSAACLARGERNSPAAPPPLAF